MPWTAKQEKFMWANHPDVAKRVMNEAGYHRRKSQPKKARYKGHRRARYKGK